MVFSDFVCTKWTLKRFKQRSHCIAPSFLTYDYETSRRLNVLQLHAEHEYIGPHGRWLQLTFNLNSFSNLLLSSWLHFYFYDKAM